MDTSRILSHVDHTQLKADSSWEDVQKVCDEAVRHGVAAVCVPPSYVARIKEKYADKVNICTVAGFPLGYSVTEVKVAEVKTAIQDGASEVDMVVNLGDVKNGDFDKVTAEIKALKDAAGDKILKVIIETCYLTGEEKIRLCKCVTDAGADFIKTSTGFGSGGAVMEDILLFKKHVGSGVKIKAAGGVRTLEDLEAFIDAGCVRVGTSSAIKLLAGEDASGY